MAKKDYEKITVSGNCQDVIMADTLERLISFANTVGTTIESLNIGPVDIIGEYRLNKGVFDESGFLKEFTIKTNDGWENFYSQVESIADEVSLKIIQAHLLNILLLR